MFSAVGAQAADMLTSKDGMTLYVFDMDKDGMSTFYGDLRRVVASPLWQGGR